ncbi:methyl-accepting chemotaxis sensory transducer with Cache sensor [Halanaerobium saccharolyticum]|uniref:Methyl-accepting chemotaxis sensory transducer with Cache sensor n=1 Tax=Halanaerobium saccharolyticum TaxID=43595 RepID=A0A4R7Z7X9_9FIRM|nr:methyl-accepting chemotaxis protein [Halanaerobium saccharolyticum]RAK08615.1 methyl-accepting chemotaxis sensory transducer with Cache sensor [Halanaerobium saccharolyticum]TDW07242.1 methyl-accepting chemotaxis sensory transducer with Cache sensor [Halanaerobium saccharolyticum]TDX60167.1 methyl-accepting chemotaxis sensory transducer with Cache sensor [Halanaerobium saccharolyticum]
MFKSIKTKMIILVSLMLFLLIAGSSFYAFRQSENILSNTLQSEAENSAGKSVETIRLWTEEKGKIIQNLNYLDSIRSMDWERQYNNLKPISDDDPQIESLFIVEPDGNMRDTNQFETSVASQSYFQQVTENREQVFSEPTESFETGRPITIIASPIFRDDEFVGIVGAVVALDILQEMAVEMDINGNGYGMILDQDGNILAHPNDDYLGNQDILADQGQGFENTYNNFLTNESGYEQYQLEGENWQAAYATVDRVNWTVALTAREAELFAPLDILRNSSFFAAAAAILIGIIVSYLIARSIVNPIRSVAKVADKVADGDLTQRLAVEDFNVNQNDELGQLLQSINSMVAGFQQIIDKVKTTAGELAASSEELSASGSQVEKNAEEVGNSIESVAAGAEEQSAQIEEISSSISTLNKIIANNAQKSDKMIDEAESVKENIEQGTQYIQGSINQSNQVQESNKLVASNVEELGDKSREIGEIVDLINQIADQTNLLALNAAIEAARAGEAGRGFSVVADEIRELAEESADATERINKLIHAIQNSVDQVIENNERGQENIEENVEMVEETGQVFIKIESSAEDLLNLINQVADNSNKMKENSDYVESGITDIAAVSETSASNSEEVAAASEEQIAATEEIVSSAKKLSEYAEELKTAVNQFKI